MKKWMFAIISVIIVTVLVLLDQYTKYLTLEHIAGESTIPIIDKVLCLTFVKNQGSAFGIMQGQFILFYVMTVVILTAIIYAFWKTPMTRKYGFLFAIMILITAGALGNTYDRIFRGYVVDMIYFELINFPVFNVADCYVTISCFLFIFLLIFYYKDEDLAVYALPFGKNKQTKNGEGK